MIDYMLWHDNTHEVFECYGGETIARCTTEALALQLCHLYEGEVA